MPRFREVVGHSADAPGAGRARLGDRLPRFVAARTDPETALRGMRVMFVGAGAVGRFAAVAAARLQIARLVVVDHGRYGWENLTTQAIEPRDVRDRKASNTGRICKRVSPATRVFVFDGPVEDLPATAYHGVDLVVLGVDNLSAEVEVGQWCLRLRRPLLQISVHGATLTAQCRFFGNDDGTGPCPACLYGREEWQALDAEARYSCSGAAEGDDSARIEAAPTMGLAALAETAAGLGVLAAVRDAAGLGAAARDRLFEYNAYRHATAVAPMRRNDACPCDHAPWGVAAAPRPLGECTPRELAAVAGLAPGDGALPDPGREAFRIQVDGAAFASQAACVCGHVAPLHRFVGEGAAVGRCPSCRRTLRAHPFTTRHAAPASLLGDRLDAPLSALAPSDPQWVVVSGGESHVLLRPPSDPAGVFPN